MVYVTGDLHGGVTAYHVTSRYFKPAKRGDIVICCGDFGAVWHHDYHTNDKNRRNEDGFLEKTLRQRVLWLAADGNHENFARLFGGEFPLVELFGGRAYKIRENIYYLKRGEIFSVHGATFLAFGGAVSQDRFGMRTKSISWSGGYDYVKPRVQGKNWWPEEIPDRNDFENACRNLDKHGWQVDYVISHTCPSSQRSNFVDVNRFKDPTEEMLQELIDRGLKFKEWHFGHFHRNQQVGKYHCHYNEVKKLRFELELEMS